MKRKNRIILLALLLLTGVIITYSNHFHNDFHFDDSHTISNNIYIRNLSNIPSFFTDMKTFGSMPDNLGYRPVVTTSTAIDYWLGGGLDPFWFHMSMFVMFLIQGFLMIFLLLKIYDQAGKHSWNIYAVFFGVAWYLFHPGNAETINYITSRSDSFSTLFVIAGLLLYASSAVCRRYFLYMIPVVLGILTKESAVMFPLLLWVYIFLFDKKSSFRDLFRGNSIKHAWSSVGKVFPALIITLLVAFMAQFIALQQTANSGFLQTRADSMSYHGAYLLTQPYVLLTYALQFFVPTGLSSDPDLTVFDSAGDFRMYIGFVFILGMIWVIFRTSRTEKWRPVAFGLMWFLIASLPTSFLAALTQVSNSHRLFFPYVGLVIAFTWALYQFVLSIQNVFPQKLFRRSVVAIIIVMLISYAYGTYDRNRVWKTEESLWYDIAQKSPGNARALMNYGLAKMGKGEYWEAEYYYRQALALWPQWTYLHINMGVLKGAMGQTAEAEQYFANAIQYGGKNPETYYYYARFLNSQGRKVQAIANLQTAIQLSAAHLNSRTMLMGIYAELGDWDALKKLALSTLEIVPGDATATEYLKMAEGKATPVDSQLSEVQKNPTPEGYLSLSLSWYQKEEYQKCIEACQEALKLKPDYAEAYNNICSAYNAMGMWDKGIEACEQALKLKPDYPLARNNLNWAKGELAKVKP